MHSSGCWCPGRCRRTTSWLITMRCCSTGFSTFCRSCTALISDKWFKSATSIQLSMMVSVDPKKLENLGNVLTSLDPGDSTVIASSFSHMLNLVNLAEEVQIAHRRRAKLKRGDFADEHSATTKSDIEETLKRLVVNLKKLPEEVFDALKNQAVDLVFTAHPIQSIRRSLLQKHGRSLMRHFREIQSAFRTDEIRTTQPTPQDEMRAGMSYFHETIWKGVPKFLRRVDTALKNIGINEQVPYNAPLIQFSSWMGGDRNGNPRVTPEVTRDVRLLARMMAANLYYSQIEDLMFEILFSLMTSGAN